jgi:hypothetical protein
MAGVGGVRGCPDCARKDAKLEAAQEQNRELRREMGLIIKDGVIGLLMNRLNLHPKHALLVVCLYQAKGRMIRIEALMEFTGITTLNSLKTSVCRVRAILGKDAIVNHGWGRGGYSITPRGMALVNETLDPITA